ncbi:MAG: hypothetical protein FJ276_11610 [Planctomycetes bacterium]|nr:hypothetical protein [Planctomycetota bacterium]
MPGIMADHNIEGHFQVLIRILFADPWRDIWSDLGFDIVSFNDLGLSSDASDADLWKACQAHEVVLVTANRNKDGSDSLEAAIAQGNQPSSLPVLTVSDADQILTSREYATRVVSQLLEFLFDLDNVRGTGRLYVPCHIHHLDPFFARVHIVEGQHVAPCRRRWCPSPTPLRRRVGDRTERHGFREALRDPVLPVSLAGDPDGVEEGEGLIEGNCENCKIVRRMAGQL